MIYNNALNYNDRNRSIIREAQLISEDLTSIVDKKDAYTNNFKIIL